MKVSIFINNLAGNGIVRAYPIAKAIQMLGHEVEVLGLIYDTDKFYEPYKNEFEYKAVRSYFDIRWVIINSRKLAKMATGDMVYSFKPLWNTFLPALLYSGFGMKRRLILDAEDNELWDSFIGNGWKELRKSKYYPINPVYNKILHPFTFLAKRKTMSSTNLQKRYGGILVLHGPQAEKFNPHNYASVKELRLKFHLPENTPLLLFAGKPVYYNGLDSIIKALLHPHASDWDLVLAGDKNSEAFIDAKNKLKERCHLLGFIAHAEMPEIIKMCDVAPIIQTPCPTTKYQLPAKMLEAMAMGKGIITTDVSDMKKIIGIKNGWIVPYGDINALADLLNFVKRNPKELRIKGDNARKFFLQNASIEVIAGKIKPFFE